MTYSCESFLDYTYGEIVEEGDKKIPIGVRIQNAIDKLIMLIKKLILKIRGLKSEHVVPRKVLTSYQSLSKMCYNCIMRCKSALQSGEIPKVVFTEPYDSQEYKILFSEEVKKKTSPGEYVKIKSSEVLNNMNGALTALTSAKAGLRSTNTSNNPNQASAFTQIINYSKFMLKISNRVLSYKNMYVEKKHLDVTEVNEAYMEFERECDIALELFGLFKKKEESITPPQQTSTQPVLKKPSPEANKYRMVVCKKTADYLKKYTRAHRFDQKYKQSFFSYALMDIQVDDSNGVAITQIQNGVVDLYSELNPKDQAYLKKKFGNMSEEELEKRHPEFFDNKWYYELLDVGVEYAKSLSTDKFEVKAESGDGDEGLVYIDVYDKLSSTTESYLDVVEEGIFGLFQKNKITPEERHEMEDLRISVSSEIAEHLKEYVKKKNFDKKYKDALCSYPTLDIKVDEAGVNVTNQEDGIVDEKDLPDLMKMQNTDIDNLIKRYPREFNNQWMFELMREGERFCRSYCKVPEPYKIHCTGQFGWNDYGIGVDVVKK